ncbi:uncharacterized protein Z520_05688 [Fonsecaea multimorphosa CBS 102226]|uniref:Alpha/beta hydrolase fold-3 domain-containing protein n=1 Tax=Fonsecaea multimorphosa CBS 102226 TaxID=1442371 RepID=A0A0D2JXY9_9EURO|nr:uncharacterized protein Z520_05688 [Fonsecaea multimorphosa CBS 102226]KIX98387.1 hypothetical protein Z520_05688 [Fonsecaea multimorphosa CBS 102226]OAL24580.1 hypothetical protein AYO22_05369 [Fonsecaea multimorphosa]
MSSLDKEYLLSLATIDPELKAFLDNAQLPPPPSYDDLDAFKKMSALRSIETLKALGDPPPEIRQSELQYPTRDGSKVRAKLYQPSNPGSDLHRPLIVMFHGGGFCIGTPESEEQSCRNFVQAFGAVCISATYRLAPEFPFPYAVNDAWDAMRWAAEKATSWGADPSAGFVVGGTSAGGNLSAIMAHLARDEGLSPPLTGQYLAIPTVLPPAVVPEKYKEYYLSYEQNRHSPVLPVAAMDMFLSGYKPQDNDGVQWAVFNHPNGHRGLPPALFQIDGMDPLRDEALIYERVLRDECGVKTRSYVYPGMPHGHWAFFPFLKSSDKFRVEQIEGMGWLLGKKPDFSTVVTNAKPASA